MVGSMKVASVTRPHPEVFGHSGAKFVTSLGEDVKKEKQEEEEALLDNARAHLSRQLAARANYMTLDRSVTQFAVKEICRGMSKPTGELCDN